MHELAFTESLIKLVSTEAEKRNFQKCLGITVAVGKYSGMVPECIRQFFPLAAKGSIAAGAELSFTESEDPFNCYVEYLTVE